MVATRVLVYTMHIANRAQFLQSANGEWCHWCWSCCVVLLVVDTALANACKRNFICSSWMCMYIRACVSLRLPMQSKSFVICWANDKWMKSMAQKHGTKTHKLANHVVKVKCGEQKQWENMHYRSHICEKNNNRKRKKIIVNVDANVNARARCCYCCIFSFRCSSTNLNGEFITLDAHGAHYSC